MNHESKIEALAALGNLREIERLGLHRVDTERYVDEQLYRKELATIWRRCWLWVGRADELANAGDFFVLNLPFLNNTSVIVLRGKDSKLRGFLNACQHRGGRLAYYERGHAEVLVCNFHGWTYDLEGRLRGVTANETFCNFEREERSLKPVSVDTWGGWVFVNLDCMPRWTLEQYLSPLPQALGAYLADKSWRWAWGRKGLFNCNWKLTVDAQAEGYHARFLHARSIMAKFRIEDIPTWVYLGSPGVPYKMEVHLPATEEGPGFFQSKLAELAAKYPTATYYNADAEDDHAGRKSVGALNLSGGKRWAFDVYGIFPNTVIIVQRGHLLVMRAWPRGVDNTTWDYDEYFTRQPHSFGEYLARLQGLLEMRNTITEDMTTVEGLQSSYSSGALTEMLIGEGEVGVSAFERHLSDMIRELSEDPPNRGT